MSLKTAHLQPHSFFYAVGNTPAVTLTQSLPPDEDAALLLLGCGDVRSVLFTAYTGAGIGSRKLDYTCCDLEAEIIARNIIVYTLIVDDIEGKNAAAIWNIYYHTHIDDVSLHLLEEHVQKLLEYAASLEDWERSPYAKWIRFCDSTTFVDVTKLWRFYAPDSPSKLREQQKILNDQWKAAQKFQKDKVGKGTVLDGLRSYAPNLDSGTELDEISKHYETFWKYGSFAKNQKSTKANPLFACLHSGLMLHYGTNPLLGFHLALTRVDLNADSPQKPSPSGLLHLNNEAAASAFSQFNSWSQAFRANYSHHTLRFVRADAIAFCHVLQYHREYRETKGANWYRSNSEYRRLELDGIDYGSDCLAPTSFNVIETSNLLDHLGSLNVLAAVAPLSVRKSSSVILTEILLPREMNVADSSEVLLSGDLSTMASLLGLAPFQYWTNTSATWHWSASVLRDRAGSEINQALSRQVVVWSPVEVNIFEYDARDLATLLHGTFSKMFQDENLSERFKMFTNTQAAEDVLLRKIRQHDLYTRATLCSLLGAIRNTIITDWPNLMLILINRIQEELNEMNMGGHYFQSFMALSEIMGCRYVSEDIEKEWQPSFHRTSPLIGPLAKWRDIPNVVNVTLVVPRKAVTRFLDIAKEKPVGTPICHMQLSSSRTVKQCIFPDVQLGFGEITVIGEEFTNEYALLVRDDEKGWQGQSPLLVSALVPTCVIMDQGFRGCKVHLGLKNVPATTPLLQHLGLDLVIYQSLIERSDVFITKHRPNMAGHMAISSHAVPTAPNDDVSITVYPTLNNEPAKLASLRLRFDIRSSTTQSLLQSGVAVAFQSRNPFVLALDIGRGRFRTEIKLPVPLDIGRGKTRIARKSCWVELDAPIEQYATLSHRHDSVFPIFVDNTGITLANLHYLEPTKLPSLRIGKEKGGIDWLISAISPLVTMSTSEFSEYEQSKRQEVILENPRIDFKDSIYSMFVSFCGIGNARQTSLFALSNEAAGGVNIMILGSSIRIDLANQTVLLDAAVIPLSYSILEEYIRSVGALQTRGNVMTVNVGNTELDLWKYILPSSAERCRSWKHKPTCEYRVAGKVPLTVEQGKQFMCSCGLGKFPSSYLENLKEWKALRKLAVRVAIPVCYTSPMYKEDSVISLPKSLGTSNARAKAPPATATQRLKNLDSKKGSCFECGARQEKAGSALLKCAGCKFAQYCSAACQKTNWSKEHKQICKQLKGA